MDVAFKSRPLVRVWFSIKHRPGKGDRILTSGIPGKINGSSVQHFVGTDVTGLPKEHLSGKPENTGMKHLCL